jgi:hypothetical protein
MFMEYAKSFGSMQRRAVSIASLGFCMVACSSLEQSNRDKTSDEPVGEARQPVVNGITDLNDNYRYVGALFRSDDENPDSPVKCSATLITPLWVLTASHCIRGLYRPCAPPFPDPEPSFTNQDFDVIFELFPSEADVTALKFEHHNGISGNIITLPTEQTDECSHDDAARDLALIKLDQRVPLSVLTPKHPPLPGDCTSESSFTGTLVGFGPTTGLYFDVDNYLVTRVYKDSDGWELFTEVHGNYYDNVWAVPPAPLWLPGLHEFWYNGFVKGDSGGALIANSTGKLCGVISRFAPTTLPFPLFTPAWENNIAAVDSPAAEQFFADHIIDSKGNFMGECHSGPMDLRDVDNDGDLIPDACDPCPDIPDPSKSYDLSGGANDIDMDGVPDMCDNCPTVGNPYDEFSHTQVDVDGDGVGEACELCFNSHLIQHPGAQPDVSCCIEDINCGAYGPCIPVDPNSTLYGHCGGFGGRCALPLDNDFDMIGDSCDSCPGKNNGGLGDMDGDGVGDACDNCPGTPLGSFAADVTLPCDPTVPGFCSIFTGESMSFCVAPHLSGAGTTVPRCTQFTDTDDDGVGNVCDSCPNVKNPYEGKGLQPNCNIHAEAKDGMSYPFIGDACDPYPCAELDIYEALSGVCPTFPCPPPPPVPDEWLNIGYSTNVLPKNQAGAIFNYPTFNVPSATVGLRRCDCSDFVPPGQVSVATYDMPTRCPINHLLYDGSMASNWTIPEVQFAPNPELPPGGSGPFATNAEIGNLGIVDPVPFHDTLGFGDAGEFTDYSQLHIGSVAFPKSGILWSRVAGLSPLSGLIPPFTGAPSEYAERANHYEAARFGAGSAPPDPQSFLPSARSMPFLAALALPPMSDSG